MSKLDASKMDIKVNLDIDDHQLGQHFACSDSEDQAEFLRGWVNSANSFDQEIHTARFKWAMKCVHIIGHLNPSEKARIASLLRELVEHLEE